MRARAKALRREPTLSERRLWNWLRNRSFQGFKFRRQVPVANAVVDFFCAALMLAIEVDGQHHETAWMAEHDGSRTALLERRGIEVIRVSNELLARDPLTVEAILEDAITRRIAALG
jgi:5-methyltetrahydrofolate--homocysteine methyltransferase